MLSEPSVINIELFTPENIEKVIKPKIAMMVNFTHLKFFLFLGIDYPFLDSLIKHIGWIFAEFTSLYYKSRQKIKELGVFL